MNLSTVLVMQIASFVRQTLPYQLILAFSLQHKDKADSLVLKCLKKLNKSLQLHRDGKEFQEVIATWLQQVFLHYAQQSVDNIQSQSELATVMRNGTVVFDGLRSAAAARGLDKMLEAEVDKVTVTVEKSPGRLNMNKTGS